MFASPFAAVIFFADDGAVARTRMEKLALSIAHDLYGGVLGQEGWHAALKRIRNLTGAESACTVILDRRAPAAAVGDHSGGDERAFDEYTNRYSRYDPAENVRHRLQLGNWYIDWQWFTRHALDRDPFYQEFMRPYGLRSVHALPILKNGVAECCLSLQFPLSQPDTDEPSKSPLLRLLAPHLQQAATLRHEFLNLQQRAELAQQLLDDFSFPLLATDAQGRVYLSNRAGATWLSLPGNPFGASGLKPSRAGAGSRLAEALVAACTRRTRLATGAHVEFGTPPIRYAVVAMPLPEPMSFPLSTYEPLALVKVHTHDATPISAHRLLHALFGIPPAEYRLLLLLMQGHHVKECAQQLGVSQETTRTQLKSLFRRTQTSRQSQLIDLVRKLTYGHMD